MSALEHPVTEFAFLNILPPTTLDTPKLATGFLREVVAQSSWSGYQLQFFHSTQESNGAAKTILYILSGWASVQAHNEWIASSESQELLKYFGDAGMMSVGGLAHLDIDFTKLSFEQCAAIVWRKMDGGDVSGSDCTKGDGKDQGASEVKPEPAALVPKDMARVLWSYRGRAVDEGSKDEYELTGYSEGELREFGEGYTVIRKWNHQRDC